MLPTLTTIVQRTSGTPVVGQNRNGHGAFVGKPEGIRLSAEDNIKTNLKYIYGHGLARCVSG
jgi:hypothetical protein